MEKKSKKIEKKRKRRIIEQANPNVQDNIKYTSQFEEGLMHVVENEYSAMYRLGELDYEVSTEEEQLNTVMSYAEGLNTLDKNSRYQLLVRNRRISSDALDEILLKYRGDDFDQYREEINQLIRQRYKHDEQNFVVEKYAIFTVKGKNPKHAKRVLDTSAKNFHNRFSSSGIDLSFQHLDGVERLKVMAEILGSNRYFATNYQDIAISGLSSKAFIAPNRIRFPKTKEYCQIGNKYATVLYIQHYPKYLEDKLIKELCGTGIELDISIHAKPYDMIEAKKNIQTTKTLNNTEYMKQNAEIFSRGGTEEMVSGRLAEIRRTTTELMEEIKDNGQKIYSGIFCVYISADSKEQLVQSVKEIQDVGDTWQIKFEAVENYKEEALNTILPIGKPYLDIEMNYMRDMTTSNVATQIPFSNIELQSEHGQFYGKNQLTNNMITISRKEDLITPSGVVLGSSGSGKGMTVKWEIINDYLKYPNDRLIIVDPESEYLPIGKKFGAQILDIATGTKHHFNILDMPKIDCLDNEDQTTDLIKEKANLLAHLFENLLKEFSDAEASMVDRVTRQTYQEFESKKKTPTLVDWYNILKDQSDPLAQELALKVEPFTIGSQDIFAHETNIDLNARFVIFNIKRLDERLKPFAMKVILDQIWKQVVDGQGKTTIHLYFDELQLNFNTEENAQWFMSLWSRIRKYGAITTGITQNVATLLDSPAGRKMISNSEFIVLLRQKISDLQRLQEVVKLTPDLIKYIGDHVPQGTGLISAGGVVVPFENPIPKNTELFRIMNTDA